MRNNNVNKNIISIKNLKYKYNSNNLDTVNLVIDNLSLDIRQGEFVAILGKNGSGKSTLAKHLNALLLPNEGEIFVNGMKTSDESSIWNIRRTVGMIFQNPDNQIIANTVKEEVAFGLENIGYEASKIEDRVYEVLRLLSMYEVKNKAPYMLSGGQKQKVAIAGVIAMEPQCIVLDEPTAMLDPNGRKEIIELIKQLNKNQNITIILITHYMEEAAEADRVVVMDQGRIVIDNTPINVFKEVELIKGLGLDVPQVTELAYELQKNNIKIDTDILNIDEMVMRLCQLL
jgi:energy-coupling factor transport system ATP-binding protein